MSFNKTHFCGTNNKHHGFMKKNLVKKWILQGTNEYTPELDNQNIILFAGKTKQQQ